MTFLYNNMKFNLNLLSIFILVLFSMMCVPPADSSASEDNEKEQAYWDSIRTKLCPRKMSSAAEYYKNRDWESTVRIYGDIVKYRCDQDDPEEVYQYYAIAFEYLGKFDSSEYVLLKGLQLLPDNINLRKRLAYSYKKQGKLDQEIMEYSRLSDLIPDDITVSASSTDGATFSIDTDIDIVDDGIGIKNSQFLNIYSMFK